MAAPEWDAIDLLPLLESLGLCTQVFACVTAVAAWAGRHSFSKWYRSESLLMGLTLMQCQHDGEIRYEFPGYNVTEAPLNSWRPPPAGEDFVYGGVLLKSRWVCEMWKHVG